MIKIYQKLSLTVLLCLMFFNGLAQGTVAEIYEAAYESYDTFKYKKAIKLLESISSAYKDSIDYHLIKGICYSEISKHSEAIKSYNQCIEMDPEFDQAYIQRGISYFAESKNSEAIKDFKQAILLNPNNPEVYLNLGTVKFDSGDEYGACKEWRKARDLGMDIANQMINDICK